jgi:hypothetical protein
MLDYLYQKTVTKFSKKKNGWEMLFIDGSRIVYDNSDDDFPSVEGFFLYLAEMMHDKTLLHFSKKGSIDLIIVELDPMFYGVSVPGFKDGALLYPERDGIEETSVPPDPSALRVVHGPTGNDDA